MSKQNPKNSVHVLPHALLTAVTLRGVHYPNNSEVLLTDIGEGDNALLCLTDNTQCCRGSDNPFGVFLGQWYFPNGSTPRGSPSGNSIYRTRGPSVVRLNRRNNATSPTGLYRCEIPDASGTTQTLFVNLTLGTVIIIIRVRIYSAHFFYYHHCSIIN